MKIVYWSGTGNTENMAEFIAEGIKKAGKEAEVINVSNVDVSSLRNEDVLVLGCPAMGDEVLEEGEFAPFIEELSPNLNNKKVALFGSYGWGDGAWMRDWEERMAGFGCIMPEEPLIVQSEPDKEDCIAFGEKIAAF